MEMVVECPMAIPKSLSIFARGEKWRIGVDVAVVSSEEGFAAGSSEEEWPEYRTEGEEEQSDDALVSMINGGLEETKLLTWREVVGLEASIEADRNDDELAALDYSLNNNIGSKETENGGIEGSDSNNRVLMKEIFNFPPVLESNVFESGLDGATNKESGPVLAQPNMEIQTEVIGDERENVLDRGRNDGPNSSQSISTETQGELLWALPRGLVEVPLIFDGKETNLFNETGLENFCQTISVEEISEGGVKKKIQKRGKLGVKRRSKASDLLLRPYLALAKKNAISKVKKRLKRREALLTEFLNVVETEEDRPSQNWSAKDRIDVSEEAKEIMEVGRDLGVKFDEGLEGIRDFFCRLRGEGEGGELNSSSS